MQRRHLGEAQQQLAQIQQQFAQAQEQLAQNQQRGANLGACQTRVQAIKGEQRALFRQVVDTANPPPALLVLTQKKINMNSQVLAAQGTQAAVPAMPTGLL